jgi:hypothetical protein
MFCILVQLWSKCFLKLHIRNNKFIYFCITVTENSSMSKPTICNCVNCNTSAKKSESFEDESAASTSSHSPFSCDDKYLTNIGRGMYLICWIMKMYRSAELRFIKNRSNNYCYGFIPKELRFIKETQLINI